MSSPAPNNSPGGPGATRTVQPHTDDAGSRLDKVLATHLAPVTRTRLKALIETGHVTATVANSGATIRDPSYRVKPNEIFTVFIPAPTPARPEPQAMDLEILHEDEELIVLDKPAGLVVHPAPGNRDHTLVNALVAHCGSSLTGIGGEARPGIVHRLDKDTSGLMVTAKTARAHASLSGQFATRTIGRVYRAFAWSALNPRTGEIEGNIGRHKIHRKKMAVVPKGGKPALTRYRTMTTYKSREQQDIACLMDLRLATGRTHQIRVHLAHLGHPIIGDRLYGRARGARHGLSRDDMSRIKAACDRQALHAIRLEFDHPAGGQRLEFEGELPEDLARLGRVLGELGL